MTSNYITVDFEEWFHGLTSTSVQYDRWDSFESRIEHQTDFLLSTFSAHDVKATFFIVGEIARTVPAVIRAIADAGHEIGLHGDRHRRVDRMSETEFKADTERNLAAIESVVKVPISGYRAAYMSVNKNTPWVWSVLRSLNIEYDSSVFPIKTPLYGMPGAEVRPHIVATPSGDIVEIPITTLAVLGKPLPFSGGVWLRNLPYAFVKRVTSSKNASNDPVIFYIHPWEFDPEHPRPDCVTFRETLSHYSGLTNTRAKLNQLLSEFSFSCLKQLAKNTQELNAD